MNITITLPAVKVERPAGIKSKKDPPKEANARVSATIESKDFQPKDTTKFLEDNRTRWYNQLQQAGFKPEEYGVLNREHPNFLPEIETCGITIRFYKALNSTGIVDQMQKSTVAAIEVLTRKLAGLPFTTLQVFCAEQNDVSVGFRYTYNHEPKAAILLGKTSLLKPVRSLDMNWTVADLHAKRDEELHMQLIVTHELGHFLHQYHNLPYYITLARVQELGGEGISEAAVVERMKSMDGTESRNDLAKETSAKAVFNFIRNTKDLGKRVSYYAFSNGLNELVAETFSALIMDLPMDKLEQYLPDPFPSKEEVVIGYYALGGPEIAGMRRPKVDNSTSASRGVQDPMAWANGAATKAPTNAPTKAATETRREK